MFREQKDKYGASRKGPLEMAGELEVGGRELWVNERTRDRSVPRLSDGTEMWLVAWRVRDRQ